MDTEFQHLDKVFWLLRYGIQNNDNGSASRAGELLQEISPNSQEILNLCIRFYMAGVQKAEEMMWDELERTGKATRQTSSLEG